MRKNLKWGKIINSLQQWIILSAKEIQIIRKLGYGNFYSFDNKFLIKKIDHKKSKKTMSREGDRNYLVE